MENSDEFFTLVCVCDTEFCPADTKTCPTCPSFQGKGMKFNVDGFLDKVYELHAQGKRADSLDVIYDAFFNFWDRFDIMTEVLQKADLSKMGSSAMLSILTNTFKYSSRLPEHTVFLQKVANEYAQRGKSVQEIKELLQGLEGDKGFWEGMAELGATGIMWGSKP